MGKKKINIKMDISADADDITFEQSENNIKKSDIKFVKDWSGKIKFSIDLFKELMSIIPNFVFLLFVFLILCFPSFLKERLKSLGINEIVYNNIHVKSEEQEKKDTSLANAHKIEQINTKIDSIKYYIQNKDNKTSLKILENLILLMSESNRGLKAQIKENENRLQKNAKSISPKGYLYLGKISSDKKRWINSTCVDTLFVKNVPEIKKGTLLTLRDDMYLREIDGVHRDFSNKKIIEVLNRGSKIQVLSDQYHVLAIDGNYFIWIECQELY